MSRLEITQQEKQKPWFKEVTRKQWKALYAAGAGWALDAMDITLYSMVIMYVMADLQMTQTVGGFLATLTLLSSAFGGIIFGMVADRYGRVKSLMISIFVFSLFTFLCGFSQTVTQLAFFRIMVGLGMGGEWVGGAALITETWDAKHRGKAMGLVQSAWAIGYATAAIVAGVITPMWGWRGVFFFGIVPALLALWMRRGIKEPEIWEKMKEQRLKSSKPKPRLSELFSRRLLKWTLLGSSLSLLTQFGYWGLATWIPSYLALPVSQGGVGLDVMKSTTWIVIMQVGAWFGYVIFGFLADSIGRKKSFAIYFVMAALLVPLYGLTHNEVHLLILGPIVALFGGGAFSGFGALFAELFPTELRATGQGFCYNFGRGVAAIAPTFIGFLATGIGLGSAFAFLGISFGLAAVIALVFLPETKGKVLA